MVIQRKFGQRNNLGDYPDFDPDVHNLPTKSTDYCTFARKKGFVYAAQKLLNSRNPGGQVKVEWIVDLKATAVHAEIRQFDCEEICRDQADRLGVKYVMIRAAPHWNRNVTVNGIPTVVLDPYTQRPVKMQEPADCHMTVYMGHDINRLLVSGHIYLSWDGLADHEISLMKDPKIERKHVVGTEPPTATRYWGMVRGTASPLKATL